MYKAARVREAEPSSRLRARSRLAMCLVSRENRRGAR